MYEKLCMCELRHCGQLYDTNRKESVGVPVSHVSDVESGTSKRVMSFIVGTNVHMYAECMPKVKESNLIEETETHIVVGFFL